MSALRVDCQACDWSTLIRREDVSAYAECGMGATLREVAKTVKRDHRIGCSQGEYHLPKVAIEEGEWDEWSQEFRKTRVIPGV